MRLLAYIATAFGTFWASAWLFGGKQYIGPSMLPNPPVVNFSYSDFIAVMLTILGLVLAALAIAIGIVAFKSMDGIKKDAKKIARKSVEDTLDQLVIKEIEEKLDDVFEKAGRAGVFDDALERAVLKISMGIGTQNEELRDGFDPSENRKEDNGQP